MTRFKVVIRRDPRFEIRPEAEQVDGKVFSFIKGWDMDSEDRYPEEVAWIPRDPAWPDDGPCWIASGDLEPVT